MKAADLKPGDKVTDIGGMQIITHGPQKTGLVCGIRLPEGLVESEKLPEPIYTPSTKAELGEHELTKGEHELKITLVDSASGQTHAWLHQLIFKGIELIQTTDEPAVPTEQPATEAPTEQPAATDRPAATEAVNTTAPQPDATNAGTATDAPKDNNGSGFKAGPIIGIGAGVLAIAAIVAVILIKKRRT